MAERRPFQEKQYALAAHIRDPDNNPVPEGADDRRMGIYRELFFNNLRSLLGRTFPVLRKIHTQDRWNRLVREFMARHESQTPYFLEIPREFLDFLEREHEAQEDDFPFLAELAHYEWVELALSIEQDGNDGMTFDPVGDLLDCVPVKSRLAWLVTYRFPVHRISPEFLPREEGSQPTYLAVCRKSNDDMDFMELNAVTARLLELIESDKGKSGRALLAELAEEIAYQDRDAFIAHGRQALEQMRDAEILLGVK